MSFNRIVCMNYALSRCSCSCSCSLMCCRLSLSGHYSGIASASRLCYCFLSVFSITVLCLSCLLISLGTLLLPQYIIRSAVCSLNGPMLHPVTTIQRIYLLSVVRLFQIGHYVTILVLSCNYALPSRSNSLDSPYGATPNYYS